MSRVMEERSLSEGRKTAASIGKQAALARRCRSALDNAVPGRYPSGCGEVRGIQRHVADRPCAGSVDAAAVSAALRQGSYDTVIGPVAFDAKGDVVDPFRTWFKFSGGDIVTL